MSIEVYQVRGDVMELIFDPREEDLRTGETLCVRERDSGNGLIVQVTEFRTVTYPSLVRELLQVVMGNHNNSNSQRRSDEDGDGSEANPLEASVELLQSLAEPLGEMTDLALSEERNLKIAVTKIRKLLNGSWDQWDGWIPHRNVDIFRCQDEELFRECVEDFGNPLHMGETLRGEPFKVEGQNLEKINIITGVKGSGKSYLSKVILLELIRAGAPCIVFDLNREYIHLPKHEVDAYTGEVLSHGILHLKAGSNLKIGLRQFGIQPLITMLTRYGLPEVSAMYLENRLFGIFEEMQAMERKGRKPPFLGIEQLIQMAEHNELAPNEVVNTAIKSRLQAVRNTGVFAARPEEAVNLRDEYQCVKGGGALVIDISDLSYLARFGFVQAIIEIVKEICEEEIAQRTERFPFVFFEEAHLYVTRNTIGSIITRSRHLGLTCFFITNMVSSLDETVLRQADNLFMMNLPFDDDVRHIAKCAMTDANTMAAFVKRLRRFHALVIGNVTRQYPIIVRVKRLTGIQTAGDTKYFFKPNGAKPEGNGKRSAREAVKKLFEEMGH